MSTKVCCTCNAEKALDLFYKNSKCAGGYNTKCIDCQKAYVMSKYWEAPGLDNAKSRAYREANKASISERNKAYREQNAEVIRQKKAAAYLAKAEAEREKRRANYRENAGQYVERAKQWKKRNPDKIVASTVKRISWVKRATPAWANEFFISEAYHLAKVREKVLGGKWHVDHIIPLRGKFVSGLHVEDNLQVIPAKANLLKGAEFIPT